MAAFQTSVLCIALLWLASSLVTATSNSLGKEFWYKNNAEELKKAFTPPNTKVAKNLVLAIGDGMGISTTTAIRVYRGQLTDGLIGEEAILSWDKFPHAGLGKTYSTDMMVPDSAASGTAYHCGVKTKVDGLGVDDSIIRDDCSTVAGAVVLSVMDYALKEGKSVGLITTDALVGASPAAAYAHTAQRDWKSDGELPNEAKGVCKDIARQLIEDNLDIQVLLGGGRKYFLPNTAQDPEYPEETGDRTDGKDLMQEWLNAQLKKGRKASVVINQTGFDQVTSENTDYLLGSFEVSRMQEETTRRINKTEPSLAEMVEKGIKILEKNPAGFYLFIEGANIDKGHHQNRARKALEEGLAFDDAVGKVMKLTSTDDTLVVVSADHSHSFVFGGYAQRGQSILSINNNTVKDTILDKSQKYFTVLSYGTGPGYTPEASRVNATNEYYEKDRVYQSVFNLKSATHAGDDVPIFASGPMSHIFTGVHEQTFIAHGMAYAACIGWDTSHCSTAAASADTARPLFNLLIAAVVYALLLD